MDKQAREAREATKQLSTKKKIENIWYYYRWAIIGTIFAVIVLAFTISECAKRIPEDLSISYYSESAINQEAVSKMQTLFGACIDDLDGDMQTYAALSPVSGKIDEMSEQAMAVQQKLQVEVAAGTATAYLFDEGYLNRFGSISPDIIEKSIDITQNEELKQKLGLGDEPFYYVVRVMYESEKNKEKEIKRHENALKVYSVIAGETPIPEVNFENSGEGNK